jgi:hypothetical protein
VTTVTEYSEHRSWQRLPLAFPVFVRGVDNQGREFMEFTTAFDISGGGLLLAVRRYLPRPSSITLEIPSAPVPPVAIPKECPRVLEAQVVRVTHHEACDLWGVKFTKPLVSPVPQFASTLNYH